jgi:hypothetical protein
VESMAWSCRERFRHAPSATFRAKCPSRRLVNTQRAGSESPVHGHLQRQMWLKMVRNQVTFWIIECRFRPAPRRDGHVVSVRLRNRRRLRSSDGQ